MEPIKSINRIETKKKVFNNNHYFPFPTNTTFQPSNFKINTLEFTHVQFSTEKNLSFD